MRQYNVTYTRKMLGNNKRLLWTTKLYERDLKRFISCGSPCEYVVISAELINEDKEKEMENLYVPRKENNCGYKTSRT